jgi:hypothetical protein
MKITELVTRLFKNLETYGDIDVFTDCDMGYSEPNPWVIFRHCNKEHECRACPYPYCLEHKKEILIL